MSYHNTTTPAIARQSITNAQGQTAPAGYHYMPDGSLMSDANHASLYGGKTIKGFSLDTSDIKQAGEKRAFTVLGDTGAVFSLQIKEGVNYYNFQTGLFQINETKLIDVSIVGNSYKGNISFPNAVATDTVNGAVTSGVKVVMDTAVASTMEVGDKVTGNAALNAANVTVAALNPDGDNANEFSLSQAIAISDGVTLSFAGAHQYDVYLFAESNFGTSHAEYVEVRSSDGAIDINSSTGSNANLVQKVIYQTLDVTIIIGGYSPNGLVTGTFANTAITTSRNKSSAKIPFSFTVTSTATKTLTSNKQPSSDDIMAFVEPTIGATPINIPGEDIYPAVTNTDTVNGAVGSGVKYVMDTNVADKMVVGDKITTAVTTDTIDGAVHASSGSKIVMDNNVAVKMNVGDAITGNIELDALSAVGTPFTVRELNPDSDNVKEFSIQGGGSTEVKILDGTTLTFSSVLNRETITVSVLNPDTDNVKEFSSSAAFAIIDGTTLSFSNQRNYRWPISSTTFDVSKITAGMKQVKGIYFASQPTVREYLTQVTALEGEVGEYKIDTVKIPAVDTHGIKPIFARDATTKVVTTTVGTSADPINITFDEQALLSFGGITSKIFSYGESEINRLTGYDVEFSDLAIALTDFTTTTTTAPSAATTFSVTSAVGIADDISTVSGIGIDSSAVNPTVTTITNLAGTAYTTGSTGYPAAILTVSAAQTLESGATLTFPGASNIATITGYIKVNSAGNNDVTLRMDVEKILTMH